jgi:hypothetical protein
MKDSTDNLWNAMQYLSAVNPETFEQGAGI